MKTCLSRILLGIERRDIGRYFEGTGDGGEVLGIGMIREFLKSVGKILQLREELKIIERGKDIEEAVAFIILREIWSSPGEGSPLTDLIRQ